ncbi:uL30 family ribosomal protein [Candidatus Pacearchaeota archaeon]|nr:uL30 family ribosomal protein [Candidatus Pacearchaeota archaeon]
MICIIRIRGEVGLRGDAAESLNRIRLRKKYSCVVMQKPKAEELGVLKKIKDFVAYGEIDDEMFSKLVEKRGKQMDKKKKTDLKKAAEEIMKGKGYEDANIKPFFRLHPPRGGIDSKIHFGKKKGVLGNHGKDINKLLERML